MSSVTMAADSTQADFTQHRRVRPAGKAALVQLGLRRGRQHVHRRDRSRSRHRSSSSRSRKPKRHSKEHQVKKSRRLRNSSRSRSHDDTSDRDSDLDLSKDLLPISGYVRIKDEMVDHMFRSISNRKLRAMLPEILRPLSSDELRRLCVEQLEVMSKKRVCRILGGADPDMISSSGTEEYDEDEEEDSSERSHDAEDDVPNVGSAYAENEVVNSTALPAAADDLPLKDSNVTSHAEIHEDDNNRKENPVVNSSRNKKELDSAGRDGHAAADRDDGAATDGKMEEAEDDGDETSTVVEKASRIDHGGLDGDEIFGITIKLNDEARFGADDMDGSADASASQEESVRMSRRNFERSYRAKQLDDDDRENDSDGGGGRRGNAREKGGVVVVAHSRPKRSREEPAMSDGESIPNSLPSLDSEPEETCCPFVFFDTKSSQELKKVVESEQRNSLSGKLPDATLATGASDSKEASTDCDLTASQDRLTHGKNSSVDPLVCPDGGATTTNAADKTRERKESVEENVSDSSERENVDDNSRKKSSPSQMRTDVEPANDSEEMIIEVHEHEFSDDGCDGDDVGFQREGENDAKKGTEDSAKNDEVSKEIHRRKEAKGSDVRCEETKLTDDDRRIGLSEKLELENTRGEEDKTVIPGRIKGPGSEQRPLKRKSVETADEVLQAKMQKVVGKAVTSGEHQSEERSESNSEQRKCVRMKNSSPTDAKAVPSSRADLQSENRPSNASDACHRSESAGSSRASASLPNPKRDASVTEQNVGKSPSKLSQASSSEDTVSSRKVARTGNPDAGSRSRVDRPELQISSSSRAESAENVENAGGRVTTSKPTHRATSHQKPGSSDRAPPLSETGKEPATPILSKTQLEILELEMRARAIKAMLKAQEELEKREEKVKTDEKRRSVVPSAAVQLPRSSEGRSVIRPESKTIRIGAGYRGEASAAGPKTTGGAELAPRVVRSDVVAAPRQSQDKRLVERRPASALSEGESFTRTVQSSQVSVARPGFKPLRDVVTSNRFPTSAYRLVKRPLVASATRGRGGAAAARGANSSCTGSRIVRLSSGPRVDNRSVVQAQRLIAMRQTSGGPDKTAKMTAAGDREDVRRVVASSAVSVVRGSPAVKVTDSSLRYGNRNRVHGPSPSRDQKRSVVAWNRRGSGGYKQQANRAGRF